MWQIGFGGCRRGVGRKNSWTRNVFNFKRTLRTEGIRVQWDDLYIRPSFAAMNKHFERFQIHKNLLLLFIFNHSLWHCCSYRGGWKALPSWATRWKGLKKLCSIDNFQFAPVSRLLWLWTLLWSMRFQFSCLFCEKKHFWAFMIELFLKLLFWSRNLKKIAVPFK